MFTPALNAYHPEARPTLAADVTLLTNGFARLHLNEDDKNSSSIITTEADALEESSEALATLSGPQPINSEKRSESQAGLVDNSQVTGSSSRYDRPWLPLNGESEVGADIKPRRTQGLTATAKPKRSDSTLNQAPLLPAVLPRQEAQERDRQGNGGQEFIEVPELVTPAGPENGGAQVGNGSPDQEGEEDALDQGKCPPAPPPSPASPSRRGFEDFFEIRPSRLGGLGAFAVRDLRRNETILVERPLLRTTHFRLLPDYHNLSEAAKRAFMGLHGGEGGDPFGRVERIKQLNS